MTERIPRIPCPQPECQATRERLAELRSNYTSMHQDYEAALARIRELEDGWVLKAATDRCFKLTDEINALDAELSKARLRIRELEGRAPWTST